MTIKVGQIYKSKNDIGFMLITKTTPIDEVHIIVHLIWNNGTTDCLNGIHKDIPIYGELIAEYDSWIEAVNSPEFKGEK